jgi:hypothetical protein
MRSHLPWLGQGDIFAEVPIIISELDQAREVVVRQEPGPAILLTHDCAMDKPDRNGNPRVETLQFASLKTFSALSSDRQINLRGQATALMPFDALYVGQIPDFGETFFVLADTFCLPSTFFSLEFSDYGGHEHADDNIANYVVSRAKDTRIGRLDQSQLDLLRRKLPAYWARVQIN